MKTKFLTLGLLLLGASTLAASPDPSDSKNKVDAGTKGIQQRAQQPDVEPSNSATNERHNRPEKTTADRPSNDQSDLDLTAKIRRSIVDDKSLSTSGHNVKIIAQNGHVTLKGPVRSEAEKKAIQQQASSIAGQPNVKDELDVQP